jgi:putative endonuclease
MTEGAFLYILRCSDGSYYIGTTRTSLEIRLAQHNAGVLGGYTALRRPVTLVYSQWFDRITDAIESERKTEGLESGQERSSHKGRFRSIAATLRAEIVHFANNQI